MTTNFVIAFRSEGRFYIDENGGVSQDGNF